MKAFWSTSFAIEAIFGESKPDCVKEFLDDTEIELQDLQGADLLTTNSTTSLCM